MKPTNSCLTLKSDQSSDASLSTTTNSSGSPPALNRNVSQLYETFKIDPNPFVPLAIEYGRRNLSSADATASAGDCFLLPFPFLNKNGQSEVLYILLDSGYPNAASRIVDAVMPDGKTLIKKIIGVILSHGDRDHSGGFKHLWEQKHLALSKLEWVVIHENAGSKTCTFKLDDLSPQQHVNPIDEAAHIYSETQGRVLIYSQQKTSLYKFEVAERTKNFKATVLATSKKRSFFFSGTNYPPGLPNFLEDFCPTSNDHSSTNQLCPFILYRGQVSEKFYHYLFGADVSFDQVVVNFNYIPRNARDLEFAYKRFQISIRKQSSLPTIQSPSSINSREFASYLLKKGDGFYIGPFDCCQIFHHGALANNLPPGSKMPGDSEDEKQTKNNLFHRLCCHLLSLGKKFFCTGSGTKYHCHQFIWQGLRSLKIPLALAYSPIEFYEEAFILEHHHNLHIMFPRQGELALPFPIFPLLDKIPNETDSNQKDVSNTPLDNLQLFLFQLKQLSQLQLEPTISLLVGGKEKRCLVHLGYHQAQSGSQKIINVGSYLLPGECYGHLKDFCLLNTHVDKVDETFYGLFQTMNEIDRSISLQVFVYYWKSHPDRGSLKYNIIDRQSIGKPKQVVFYRGTKEYVLKIPGKIDLENILKVVAGLFQQNNTNPVDSSAPRATIDGTVDASKKVCLIELLNTTSIMKWYNHEFSLRLEFDPNLKCNQNQYTYVISLYIDDKAIRTSLFSSPYRSRKFVKEIIPTTSRLIEMVDICSSGLERSLVLSLVDINELDITKYQYIEDKYNAWLNELARFRPVIRVDNIIAVGPYSQLLSRPIEVPFAIIDDTLFTTRILESNCKRVLLKNVRFVFKYFASISRTKNVKNFVLGEPGNVTLSDEKMVSKSILSHKQGDIELMKAFTKQGTS